MLSSATLPTATAQPPSRPTAQPTAKPEFAVFVSSTDSYSDCWMPFFTLFRHYWPTYQGRIYLNTETLDFQFPGLDIVCTRVARFDGGNPTIVHGKRLCLAFEHVVQEDLVLYLHEDMFFDQPVRADVLQQTAAAMRADNLLFTILSEAGNHGPFYPTAWDDLLELDPANAYFFSAMAGMWNVPRMTRYLRQHENPWQTEYHVKRRMRQQRERSFCLDPQRFVYPNSAAVPFSPDTGIFRGQWQASVVVGLFAQHGIEVDFSRRGFYDAATAAPQKDDRTIWQRLISAFRSRL